MAMIILVSGPGPFLLEKSGRNIAGLLHVPQNIYQLYLAVHPEIHRFWADTRLGSSLIISMVKAQVFFIEYSQKNTTLTSGGSSKQSESFTNIWSWKNSWLLQAIFSSSGSLILKISTVSGNQINSILFINVSTPWYISPVRYISWDHFGCCFNRPWNVSLDTLDPSSDNHQMHSRTSWHKWGVLPTQTPLLQCIPILKRQKMTPGGLGISAMAIYY